MSIIVTCGKPGSGKTYHAIGQIVKEIYMWGMHEIRSGKRSERELYTNLPFNLEAVNEYLNRVHGREIKALIENRRLESGEDNDSDTHTNMVSMLVADGQRVVAQGGEPDGFIPNVYNGTYFDFASYINFYAEGTIGRFWEHTPKYASIAIDEVHLYFSSEEAEKALKDFKAYMSTHRHEAHDIRLLTQHMDNVSSQVLKMCETVEDIQNMKSKRIPFVNIPVSDIQIVLQTFGIYNQTYCVSFGRVVGKSIKFEGNSERFVMGKEIYQLYNSFSQEGDHGGATSDRPLFFVRRRDAVKWFIGEHWFSAGWKIGAIVFGMIAALIVLPFIPQLLTSGLTSVALGGAAPKAHVEKEFGKPISKKSSLPPTSKSTIEKLPGSVQASHDSLVIADKKEILALKKELLKVNGNLLKKDLEIKNLTGKIKKLMVEKRVVFIFEGGVLLADGKRIDVGEAATFDGEKEVTLESVDSAEGVAAFSDGSIYRIR